MLVLSRRVGETIMIGDDIEVKVTSVRGNQVKLGILADGLPIHREEIYERIQQGQPRVEAR